MAYTDVVYFNSSMSSAPALTASAGTLIAILDACLVNGFGTVTLNSLVVADDVATATVSSGHNFAMIGNTGPVIRIEGATPSALNNDWRITVTSSTKFTFATSGISNQTATGTITAKRKPAGFSKAFSGTNKAAYLSDDQSGLQMYCRIDDTGTSASNARIRGYETMSDVDTGTGPFPTDTQLSGGSYIYKCNSGTVSWSLISDGRMIYCFCDAGGGNNYTGGFYFGDINSYLDSDAYSSILVASTANTSSAMMSSLSTATGGFMARSYTQTGTAVTNARYSHQRNGNFLGNSGQAYPAPVDNSIHLYPVECWEGTTLARGMMPGLWSPVHNNNTPHGTVVDDIPQLPGRTLLVQSVNSYKCALDLRGSWR